MTTNLMDLTDQRALIVGGTSGIGLAVAQGVARAGGVPLVASRSQANVDRALAALPAGAEGATVDLADPASIAALVSRVEPIDHLVYTAAGPLSMTMLADLTPEIAHDFFETRLFGAIAVVRAAAPSLRPGGSITLTGGSAGERPGAGWSLGASVSGAIASLVRALALELAPLRVNAIAPGVLRSDLWSGIEEADRERMYAQVGAGLPLGRVGEVDDAAYAYLYAMTQPWGTGVVLPVDGGTLIA